MALLNTEANTVEDLASQLRAQWSGDWNINGQDQAEVLARMLWERGVRDLSQMKLAEREYARRWDAGGLATRTAGNWDNEPDSYTAKGYALDFGNGVTLGDLGDQGKGGLYSDQGVLNYLGSQYDPTDPTRGLELGWNSQGHGNVSYRMVQGADGKPRIMPAWGSSSDASEAREIAIMAAALYGGASLLGEGAATGGATTGATAGGTGAGGATSGATAGTTGGGGLLGGSAGAGGSGLSTTAAMQSAMTPAGLTNASGASLGAAGSVTGGSTGFSLGNLFGGISGKDWLGAVGTAIQYADGRRQQRQTEATRAAERAEDREYNDKIRSENRGWSLEDRDNERAYAAQQLAEKQQRIGTTGGGLLGVSLKRKGI